MSAKLSRLLVIDVGGSHISIGSCALPKIAVTGVVHSPLPPDGTPDVLLDLIESSAAAVEISRMTVAGVGIAIAAPFDYGGGISLMRHKLEYLYGFNLKAAIAQRFSCSPDRVTFINDADAFLLGETGAGTNRGKGRVVGITLGTGIGSAFSVDGIIVTEGPGVPTDGEIWNLPFEDGIIEDQISTRALQALYVERTGLLMDVEVMAREEDKNSVALEVFAEFGRRLGIVIQNISDLFQPQVVILGGGIVRSAHLFLPQALLSLDRPDVHCQVSTQLDYAPLLGAAVNWISRQDSLISK